MPNRLPALAHRLTRPTCAALVGLSAALAGGTWAYGQPVDVQLVEGIVVEGEDPLADILGPDYEPGFQVQRGDHREEIDDAINAFHGHLDNGEWEKAFRQLIALTESTRHIMAPMGETSIYRPIRRSIQERLRSLPLEGRRAFQQFYDAQAREMLSKARDHDQPGSDEQVRLAREVYELFLLTSSGDAAADLLGNLYFERGEFEQAQACWLAILEHHPGTSLPELDLQFRRVVAMHRAGLAHEAHALAEQVALRFAGREVAFAGGQVDVAQALRELLGAAPDAQADAASGATVPAGLPGEGELPLWQMTFANDATAERLQNATGQRYYGPTDLRLLIPPTAADDRAVYAHWHGVAFAMDLATGKLLWRTGQFNEAPATLTQRMSSATGTPRGYKIALTEQLVLVQSSTRNGGGQPFDRFHLTAYDKETGERAWDSASMPQWHGHSFCGQPLVTRGQAYVITHPVGGVAQEGQPSGNARSLTLHRIDATTGRRLWSLPLGDADVQANPYIQFVWMPQPTLLLDGRTLFVLTNNGALMAVDTGAGEVAWAARLHAPEGIGDQNPRNMYNIQPPSANAQGAGAMFIRAGVLYAKEARSPRVYAFNPPDAEVLWERAVPADAELIGVDADNLYVMAPAVRAYPLNAEGRMAWNNNQVGGPAIGSGLLADDTLYLMGGNKLRALSLENGDPAGSYPSRYLRGNGGQLLMVGDKLICVTQRDITCFQVPSQPAPRNPTTPGE